MLTESQLNNTDLTFIVIWPRFNGVWPWKFWPWSMEEIKWNSIVGTEYHCISKIYAYCFIVLCFAVVLYINGLKQERLNSIANALELCISCTKPWTWSKWNHEIYFDVFNYIVCGKKHQNIFHEKYRTQDPTLNSPNTLHSLSTW